jgi:2-polyprenyl-3-methyl-5-hydroxy-6-metoxy-1,4-benzoquinol methylase
MENQNYDALETHFNSFDTSKLRGLVSENSTIGYAAYVLDRIAPHKGATMLDIGCGDGLMMHAILMLRPDLNIDGIELSPKLTELAKINNPESEILCGNIMEMDISIIPKKYDYVFSFSFLQYIPAKDVGNLQSRIQDLILDNGVIIHCSVPDKRFRLVTTVVTQVKKRGNVGFLIAPVMHILYILYHKNRYGVGGFWHDPVGIEKALSSSGEINVLASDVYYRFDIVHKMER